MNINLRFRMSAIAAMIVVAALFMAPAAHAQMGGGKGEGVEKMVTAMKEKLALSDAQTTKVRNILTSSRQQAEQDRAANKGDRQAMMSAMRTRMESADKEIEAVLTADQVTKYQAMKTEMRTKMQNRMQNGRGQRGQN